MSYLAQISIDGDAAIHSAQFHPNRDIIAAALVDGRVSLHSTNPSEHSTLWEYKVDDCSCRTIQHTSDGLSLLSGFTDRHIRKFDTETGTALLDIQTEHGEAINTIHLINDNIMASGDDNGSIHLTDLRSPQQPLCKRVGHGDFISQMIWMEEKNKLIAVSGDGKLSVWSLRKDQLDLDAMSDCIEDELLSLAVMKEGKKLVCGSQDGVLNIFSYGDFGDISDRFPGHPNSIDSILALDEDTLCTGGGDGCLRLVSLLPNEYKGSLGIHGPMPITSISLSHDSRIISSTSFDSVIKFWDPSGKTDLSEAEEDATEEDSDSDVPQKKKLKTIIGETDVIESKKSFFSDL